MTATATVASKTAKPFHSKDLISDRGVHLFHGPTGTGKTTTMLALAAQYSHLGPVLIIDQFNHLSSEVLHILCASGANVHNIRHCKPNLSFEKTDEIADQIAQFAVGFPPALVIWDEFADDQTPMPMFRKAVKTMWGLANTGLCPVILSMRCMSDDLERALRNEWLFDPEGIYEFQKFHGARCISQGAQDDGLKVGKRFKFSIVDGVTCEGPTEIKTRCATSPTEIVIKKDFHRSLPIYSTPSGRVTVVACPDRMELSLAAARQAAYASRCLKLTSVQSTKGDGNYRVVVGGGLNIDAVFNEASVISRLRYEDDQSFNEHSIGAYLTMYPLTKVIVLNKPWMTWLDQRERDRSDDIRWKLPELVRVAEAHDVAIVVYTQVMGFDVDNEDWCDNRKGPELTRAYFKPYGVKVKIAYEALS